MRPPTRWLNVSVTCVPLERVKAIVVPTGGLRLRLISGRCLPSLQREPIVTADATAGLIWVPPGPVGVTSVWKVRSWLRLVTVPATTTRR